MNVLQISADRSKRGILYSATDAQKRQAAYGRALGRLTVIGFSLRSDGAHASETDSLSIIPTASRSRWLWGWDASRIAKKLTKPDVISVQDPFESGLVAFFMARKHRVPLYVQVHTDFLSPAYAAHSLFNRLRVPLARFVLRRAARVRVVSPRIKTSLERIGITAPISVLPIFVDVSHAPHASEALAQRFATFSNRVLVVARLESEKNVALAFTAFAASAPPDACLIVVGDGGERARLQLLAAASGIAERVFFEGAQDAAPYYAIADLVLVPSRYEGYGLVIVEALAAGKPALSTDVGVAREMGAIVSSDQQFAADLAKWFQGGPRTGHLQSYPYQNFEAYVQAYASDIRACVTG